MTLIGKNKKFNLFIIGLVIINLLQSFLTPVIKDEAYYWSWSQHLDWGFFDHPPMVAFIIKLSSFFFTGGLGVRFITVLLSALMVKVIWELIPEKNKEHKYAELIFFTILFSMPFFNLYGFVTTPDAPLLFFSALYLLAFKKIEEKDNLFNILFLSFAAALLIYTKYFGGIVILLSILFKPKLLLKRSSYIAGIVSLILLAPYIFWLYKNDFITLNYHLFQRKSIGYFQPKFVYGYVLGTLGVLNPGLIILLLIQIFKKKIASDKQSTFMMRMFVGYLLFFLIYSFRSWIEGHWVAFATIPMTILLYNLSVLNPKVLSKVKYIGIVSIVLIFALRIVLVLPLPLKTEFHIQKKDYYESIDKFAADRVVIFINSYQNASKFNFYTAKRSFSVNDIFYRKNQYDLWHFADEIENKKVIFIGAGSSSFTDSTKLVTGDYVKYKEVDNFRLIGALKATMSNPIKTIYSNQAEHLQVTIYNPYTYNLDLNKENTPYQIALNLEKDNKNNIVPLSFEDSQKLMANLSKTIDVSYNLNNIKEGHYKLSIVIKDDYLYYRQISKKYKVEVKSATSD